MQAILEYSALKIISNSNYIKLKAEILQKHKHTSTKSINKNCYYSVISN